MPVVAAAAAADQSSFLAVVAADPSSFQAVVGLSTAVVDLLPYPIAAAVDTAAVAFAAVASSTIPPSHQRWLQPNVERTILRQLIPSSVVAAGFGSVAVAVVALAFASDKLNSSNHLVVAAAGIVAVAAGKMTIQTLTMTSFRTKPSFLAVAIVAVRTSCPVAAVAWMMLPPWLVERAQRRTFLVKLEAAA